MLLKELWLILLLTRLRVSLLFSKTNLNLLKLGFDLGMQRLSRMRMFLQINCWSDW